MTKKPDCIACPEILGGYGVDDLAKDLGALPPVSRPEDEEEDRLREVIRKSLHLTGAGPKERLDALEFAMSGVKAVVAVRRVGPPPDEDEEDSCDDERRRLASYDQKHLEAAKAIKESDQWADNHWPSTNDRIWYVEAQTEIARLRAASEPPPDAERVMVKVVCQHCQRVTIAGWSDELGGGPPREPTEEAAQADADYASGLRYALSVLSERYSKEEARELIEARHRQFSDRGASRGAPQEDQ